MLYFKQFIVLSFLLTIYQQANAQTVFDWNFDTSWTGNTVADSSGLGLLLGPRGQFDTSTPPNRIRNSTGIAYDAGTSYGRSGGVAILTNGGEVSNLFSGVNVKPGTYSPTTFAQLMDRSNNPFMQVDIWNGAMDNTQFYSNSITLTQTNRFISIGTSGSNVINAPVWNANGWNTYRIELHADGTAHGFVNGFELGTSSGLQSLSDINNGSLGVIFASPNAVVDNFRFGTIAPVPEPETYALLLAGLGVIGAIRNRQRTTIRRHMGC